jgi:hypothetical protein
MKLFGYEFIVRKAVPQEIRVDSFLCDASRVTLNKGDTVVFMAEGCVSNDTAIRIQARWEEINPGTNAVILGDGMRLSVLGPSDRITH